MRLYELTQNINSPVSNLLTALEMLRQRNYTEIKTQSLINLVSNTDQFFNYDALVDANENYDSVKNLIKSLDNKVVKLQPYSDDETEESDDYDSSETPDSTSSTDSTQTINNQSTDQNQQPDVNTVKDMATRAAFNRGAPVGIRV